MTRAIAGADQQVEQPRSREPAQGKDQDQGEDRMGAAPAEHALYSNRQGPKRTSTHETGAFFDIARKKPNKNAWARTCTSTVI